MGFAARKYEGMIRSYRALCRPGRHLRLPDKASRWIERMAAVMERIDVQLVRRELARNLWCLGFVLQASGRSFERKRWDVAVLPGESPESIVAATGAFPFFLELCRIASAMLPPGRGGTSWTPSLPRISLRLLVGESSAAGGFAAGYVEEAVRISLESYESAGGLLPVEASVEPRSSLSPASSDVVMGTGIFDERSSVGQMVTLIRGLLDGCRPDCCLLLVCDAAEGRVQRFHCAVSKVMEGDSSLSMVGPCPSIAGRPCGPACYVCRLSSDLSLEGDSSRWCHAVLTRGSGITRGSVRHEPRNLASLCASIEDGDGLRVRGPIPLIVTATDEEGRLRVCDQSNPPAKVLLRLPDGMSGRVACGELLSVEDGMLRRMIDDEEEEAIILLECESPSSIRRMETIGTAG